MRQITLLGVLGLLVATGACAAGGPVSPPSTSTGGSPTAAPADELTITVHAGSGQTSQWRLTCNPPGGTHPDPAGACRVLANVGETALPAVAKDLRCTQVYGGPETATITGTWRGQPIDSRLSRVNGCEISRWNALVGVLPRGGG